MREIPLSRGYVALISDKDYPRVSRYEWHVEVNHGNCYGVRNIPTPKGKRTTQKLHRFILGLDNPKVQVDHKDGNGLNCQRRNLRKSSNLQNSQNRKRRKDNTSGIKGVHWHTRLAGWRARIQVNGKRISLGVFKGLKDAARAYNQAAVLYFGRFAKLNSVEDCQ